MVKSEKVKDSDKIKEANIKKVLDKNICVEKNIVFTKPEKPLTLVEEKLVAIFLSKININHSFDEYIRNSPAFEIKDLANTMGIAGNMYSEIKKSIKSIQKKVFEIYDPSLNKDVITAWITSAEMERGSGKIKIYYPQPLYYYLCHFMGKMYSQFSLRSIILCSSIPLLNLYKLLASYKNLRQNILEIKVDELQKEVGANYSDIKFFNSKFLKPSLFILNQNSELNIKYEKIRDKDNKIILFKFMVDKKEYVPEISKITIKEANSRKISSEFLKSTIKNNKIEMIKILLKNGTELSLLIDTAEKTYPITPVDYESLINTYGMFQHSCQMRKLGNIEQYIKNLKNSSLSTNKQEVENENNIEIQQYYNDKTEEEDNDLPF